MELVLAVLMALGIFLVIPVVIGFSVIGIYLLNKRRALNTEKAELLKNAVADVENIVEANYTQVSGSHVSEKNESFVESK